MASAWLSSWTGPSAAETEWVNELAEAQHLLRDVAIDLQDRDAKFKRGADAARLTAGIRRRVRHGTWPAFGPGFAAGCRAGRPPRCAARAPRAATLCTRARVGAAARDVLPARRLASRKPTLTGLAAARPVRRKSASMTARLERLELEILPKLTLCEPDARPDARARRCGERCA